MIAKQAVEVVPEAVIHKTPGFYSRMFVVPKKNGKWRPIIDLSPLNKAVECDHFKMETPASVLKAVTKGQWMTSVDLSDAYYHIPIHPTSRRYLRFQFERRTYQFRALCFGLSTAPLVFTATMKPVIALLHKKGVRIHHYLDDWLVTGQSESQVLKDTDTVLRLAGKLGLRVNLKKSELVPRTRVIYLGIQIDSVLYKAFPSEERVDTFLSLVTRFTLEQAPTAWTWLRVLGHLASLEKLVLGGRRRIRPLQFRLKESWRQGISRNVRVPLNKEVREALAWWKNRERLLQGVPLGSVQVDHVMFTDASKTGWGAYVEHLQTSGLWTHEESLLHINLLEMEAVSRGLWQFQDFLRESTIAIMSDNTTVVSHINKEGGTRSRELNDLTMQVLEWADSQNMTLRSQYVPGRLNVKADALSRRRQILKTEWSLNPEVFRRVCKILGQPHIDLLATDRNAKLPTYYSPIPDPKAVGTDAFLQDWTGMWAYAFPPTALIRNTLNKAREEGTELIMIAPLWPAQEWFPDLMDLLIDDPISLPPIRTLLKQPHFHMFHKEPEKMRLHAWRLSPDLSKQQAFRNRLQRSSPDTIELQQQNSMIISGEYSAVGVIQNRLIRSRPLYLK